MTPLTVLVRARCTRSAAARATHRTLPPRKLALLVLLLGASLAFAAAPAHALQKPVWAGTCGLPNRAPIWAEFGWPLFANVFGRPGVIVSASSGDFPAQM